jgi:hypothetical protein
VQAANGRRLQVSSAQHHSYGHRPIVELHLIGKFKFKFRLDSQSHSYFLWDFNPMQATMKMKHLCLQPLPGEPNVKGMIDFLKKKPFQSKLQVFVCSFRRFFSHPKHCAGVGKARDLKASPTPRR